VKDGIIDEKDFKIYRTMTELYADTMCSVEDGSMHLKDCMKQVKMYLLSKWYLQQQVVRSFRRAGLLKYGLHFSKVRCDSFVQ
jgi:hypothetical protein